MSNYLELGAGPPLVLIPGIQGRWEYVRQALDALSGRFRVLTFPLCDEPSAAAQYSCASGIDSYVAQVRRVLDASAVERAIVCGISFGGRFALRFAAAHPERTTALVLTSTPGPAWHLRRRHDLYARLPHLFGPLFLAETPFRLRLELATAFATRSDRWRFVRAQLRTVVRAPVSLARMASRARMMSTMDAAADCARIAVPTLVVTGEPRLDHVVPVEGSAGYLTSIRGARRATLPRTGHLGSITHPGEFAAIVGDFAASLPPQRADRPEVA
jgi:3-oxoadipate enol-lactonase